MTKIYMVWKDMGMSGVWYFREKKNAEKFASKIGETVMEESMSAKEYHATTFEDGYNPAFLEPISVPFNVI